MEGMYTPTWVQELQSVQERRILLQSWLQIMEHTLPQILMDILRSGISSNRHEVPQDVLTGSYLPKMKWRQYEHQESDLSLVGTSGPLLSTAPPMLGTGAAVMVIGMTTARATTMAQCSLFGLSDLPDPPSAAPFERVAV